MLFYQALIASLFALLTESDSATIGTPSCDGLEDGTYAVEGSCRSYTICEAGIARTESCSIIDQYIFMWSSENNRCVPTTFSSCASMEKHCPTLPALKWMADRTMGKKIMETFGTLETESQNELKRNGYAQDDQFKCPEENGVFGVAEDSSFRICVSGKAFAGKCDENEVFNFESKTCVDKLGIVESIFDGPPNGDMDCADAFDGFYGITDNCRYYQVCCGGNSIVRKCMPGTRFDTITKSCTLLMTATCKTE